MMRSTSGYGTEDQERFDYKQGSFSERKEDGIHEKSEEVTIHVFDEANKVNKDFVCDRNLLLREMKYFRAYLNEHSSFDDIDISVHCDVNIFQWLMDYIKQDTAPKLDTSWAVSILISSDFLQMQKLVNQTLRFVHDRLQQIIKLPIELDCINENLLNRLADLFTDVELDQIRDKRDKIVSRLYMHKLEEMVEKSKKELALCVYCKQIYCLQYAKYLKCPKSKTFIDVQGQQISKHGIDVNWSINKYLTCLKRSMSWKQIYWRIWGLLNHFHCTRCEQYFPATEFDWCSFHPQSPKFETDTNIGVYPCCKRKAMRFDSNFLLQRGCSARNHVAACNSETADSEMLDLFLRKSKQILIPYGSPNPTGETETAYLDPPQEKNPIDTTPRSPHKYEVYHDFTRQYRLDGEYVGKYPLSLEKKRKNDLPVKMTTTRRRFYAIDRQRDSDEKFFNHIGQLLEKQRKTRGPSKSKKSLTKKKSTSRF